MRGMICGFLFVLLISYYTCFFEIYQYVRQYSFDFRNKNTFPVISSYIIEGDILRTPDSFNMTKDEPDSYGLITTSDYLNMSEFEYQINLRINNNHTKSSVFGVWFYTNKTDNPENKPFYGFTDKFNGFGVLVVTFPEEKEEKSITRIGIVMNVDNLNLKEVNILNDSLNFCQDNLRGDIFKLTIRYSNGRVTVLRNNKGNLISQCFLSTRELILDNQLFKISLSSYNGKDDDFIFQDQVEVFKVSLFNKDKQVASKIAAFKISSLKQESIPIEIPSKLNHTAESNKTAVDLVNKYYENNTNEASDEFTLEQLNKEIDGLIAYLSNITLQEEKKYNINIVSQSLNQIGSYITNLSELLNATDQAIKSKVTTGEEEDKIKLLSIELSSLREKWSKFIDRLSYFKTVDNEIQKSIDELQNNINKTQNMQIYIENALRKNVNSITKEIEKKIEGSGLYQFIIVCIIAWTIILMVWIYRKLKAKQKQN